MKKFLRKYPKAARCQSVNTLEPRRFWGYSKKTLKRTWLCVGISPNRSYGPGPSIKRCGTSSSLHSKKMFWLGGVDFLWVMS